MSCSKLCGRCSDLLGASMGLCCAFCDSLPLKASSAASPMMSHYDIILCKCSAIVGVSMAVSLGCTISVDREWMGVC